MVKLSEALPPHIPENKGRNQLLELLVAQISYKVLQRGWSNYRESPHFRRLMETSGCVVMSHLEWTHKLLESEMTGVCRASGRKRVKREDEDGVVEDGYGGSKKKKAKWSGEMRNPAAEKGCMFHEHKERGSVCRSPQDLMDDE
jgi:hypothetical protein